MTASRSHESLFGSLFSRLFEHEAEAPAEPATRLESTEQSLDDLLKQVQDKVRQDDEETAPGEAGAASSSRRTPDEIALEEREAARARLEAEILATHDALGTGLGRQEVEDVAAWLARQIPAMERSDNGSVEVRIDHQVLQELFERAGRLAWERLEELMDLEAAAWPVPADLALGRSQEELDRVLRQHRREVEETFLSCPPRALAGLARGDVAAWSHFYPDSASALWREVVLRGVAASIRIELFRATLDRWTTRPADLEERIARVLERELGKARTLVRGGIRSLDDARRVTEEVERACAQVIPDMVWDYLGKELRRERNFPGAPVHVRASATRKIRRPG